MVAFSFGGCATLREVKVDINSYSLGRIEFSSLFEPVGTGGHRQGPLYSKASLGVLRSKGRAHKGSASVSFTTSSRVSGDCALVFNSDGRRPSVEAWTVPSVREPARSTESFSKITAVSLPEVVNDDMPICIRGDHTFLAELSSLGLFALLDVGLARAVVSIVELPGPDGGVDVTFLESAAEQVLTDALTNPAHGTALQTLGEPSQGRDDVDWLYLNDAGLDIGVRRRGPLPTPPKPVPPGNIVLGP